MLTTFTNRLRRACLLGLLLALVFPAIVLFAAPAQAALDPYVTQYLKVLPSEAASLPIDRTGATREVGYQELLQGKTLFSQTCQSCHVGGSTLANPTVSLALPALQAATPPRDTLNALVTYMRHPLAYDGSDDNLYCREVSESWLSPAEVESIAAFILRAAEVAPGWGRSPM
ncbi:photosystem II cytochrome PsbV2 [Alkalinema sp. FACHB-956]|uniref:photosystem II cytochrome PsbV2 n=1 Tax=Alkalinema sp. FACHB-956 TaxID=2692768 RepID=UPI00168773E4|nr:photosystem II cytochrome PsbV2 [Alkalinema sp. FACHB-956]MBD2325595.1 photosystem II cytochrome PsbV2 [Alkalinema sp. FACHB-956]